MKTRTLYKYVEVFGEDVLINALDKAREKQKPGNIIQVTNPIVRFLLTTTKTVNGKLTVITNIRVNPNDLSYFTTVSSLLSDLKAEIFANESYKNQIAEKILATGQGPMLSALNELFIAGYCKFLGLGIELNSSKQKVHLI